MSYPLAGIEARHIYRREVLERFAEQSNLLLIGAANLTEMLTGWFIHRGVDDLPIQPLTGLYKTQVRQLSSHLGLPAGVLEAKPSPDMIPGIDDEDGLGLPYSKIDLALDHLDGGLSRAEVLAVGVRAREIETVRKMHVLSAWKRDTDAIPPAVDGRRRGGFRLDLAPLEDEEE